MNAHIEFNQIPKLVKCHYSQWSSFSETPSPKPWLPWNVTVTNSHSTQTDDRQTTDRQTGKHILLLVDKGRCRSSDLWTRCEQKISNWLSERWDNLTFLCFQSVKPHMMMMMMMLLTPFSVSSETHLIPAWWKGSKVWEMINLDLEYTSHSTLHMWDSMIAVNMWTTPDSLFTICIGSFDKYLD